MSSLIFYTEENQALVATDTLATTFSGEPAFFTSKAFIIPHIKMIICGTGMAGFLGRWFIEVNDRMVIRGIENLNSHSPVNLRKIWKNFIEDSPIPFKKTTTVYHFGFSEDDSKMHTYVYRSERNFQSEILSYGVGVKPECTVPASPIFPICIKKMMEEQRKRQESVPRNKRVYIGGEIQVIHLTREGFNVFNLDRFDDYSETLNSIFYNYEKSNGQNT